MQTIADYKEKFNQLTTIHEREQFLLETREKYKDFASPAMKRFLNNCIKLYNDEVARTYYYASKSIRELQHVFNTFTTAAEMRQFILDIKGIYGDSKNTELRRFLNKCIRAHNALIDEFDINFMDSMAEDIAMHTAYPQYEETEETEENYVVEKFPEFTKLTDHDPTGGFTGNPVKTAHEEYMEQAAQAVQTAHAGNPEYTGTNTEQTPIPPTGNPN